MKKNIVFSFFLLFISCAYPKPIYITSQGLNVYCDEGVCVPQEEVETAIDLTIAELAKQVPKDFSYERINELLLAQQKWHDIVFRKQKIGPKGSCPTDEDPARRCRGFKCSVNPNGWCGGLTHTINIYGFDTTRMHVVKYHDCVSSNALVHELLHFFHRLVLMKIDGDHLWEPYWPSACTEKKYPDEEERKVCEKESIVRAANWELCKNSCGDLCKDG